MSTANKNLSIVGAVPNAKEAWSIAIVKAEWNEEITEGLYKGAHEALIENGVAPEDIIRVNVPGSFELSISSPRWSSLR